MNNKKQQQQQQNKNFQAKSEPSLLLFRIPYNVSTLKFLKRTYRFTRMRRTLFFFVVCVLRGNMGFLAHFLFHVPPILLRRL